MGERRLTVRDRIIVHLAGYSRYAQEYECPEAMSQSGISNAIGKSRAHTTLELNRMKELNLITERLAHVKNAKSKRKTYSLTPEALAVEKQIARHIQSLEIQITDSGKTGPINGQQAAQMMIEVLSISRVNAFEKVMAAGGEINLDDLRSLQLPEVNFLDPVSIAPESVAEDAEPMTLDALILKANILSKKSQSSRALELLDSAINTFTSESDLSRLYYSRASILRKQGNYPNALKEINKSLSMACDSPLMLGRCQMEKAMVLYGTGNCQQCLELLDSAKECFAREDSQIDSLRCGINQGMVLKGIGNNKQAIAVLENSLAMSKKAGLERMEAYALVNLTDLLNEQKTYARSRKLAVKAKDIFMVLDEPLMLAAALFNLGTAQAGLGEKQEAISNLDNAISILEKHDLLTSRIGWLEKYSGILEELDEVEMAKSLLDKI